MKANHGRSWLMVDTLTPSRGPYELVRQEEKRKEALLAIRCMALSRTMWFNPTPTYGKLANRAILDFKGYKALTLKE